MHAQFRENRYLEMSTNTYNLIRISAVEPKFRANLCSYHPVK